MLIFQDFGFRDDCWLTGCCLQLLSFFYLSLKIRRNQRFYDSWENMHTLCDLCPKIIQLAATTLTSNRRAVSYKVNKKIRKIPRQGWQHTKYLGSLCRYSLFLIPHKKKISGRVLLIYFFISVFLLNFVSHGIRRRGSPFNPSYYFLFTFTILAFSPCFLFT